MRGEGGGERAGNEEGFLNKIAAVINGGGGDGHEGGGEEGGTEAERAREEKQKQNAAGASEGGDEADGRFAECGERGFAPEPRERERGVVERGTVVVPRIKRVATVLEELAGFYRLVGFVGVERAAVEFVGSQPESEQEQERKV